MYITFTHWIIQCDSITSRKSFLNVRIKKKSPISSTLQWRLIDTWNPLATNLIIFLMSLRVFSFIFFYFNCFGVFFSWHSSKKTMWGFFVWNRSHRTLKETIFCCLEGECFPSNHCRWTHPHMPAGDGHRCGFLPTFPSVGLVFRSLRWCLSGGWCWGLHAFPKEE